jgi:two-component system cell cycle response regulator DivK
LWHQRHSCGISPTKYQKILKLVIGKPFKTHKFLFLSHSALAQSLHYQDLETVSNEEPMSEIQILIVDDNTSNLKLLRVLLTGEGFMVHAATDASQCLEALKNFHPSLILADIQMPGMDGLELTRKLKASPETREIPVVAITAYAMSGDQQKAEEAGCDAYISKPIDTRTLPGLLRQILDKPRS